MFYRRTKDTDIKYHYAQKIIAEGKLRVCKISTHFNLTDMMTKVVPIAKFEFCSNLVGIVA
jgi:predicted aldo/keto reductase-like oxidoreductase